MISAVHIRKYYGKARIGVGWFIRIAVETAGLNDAPVIGAAIKIADKILKTTPNGLPFAIFIPYIIYATPKNSYKNV